jgi:sporadic carbohydrate cluster protein (TIGR04323 family)
MSDRRGYRGYISSRPILGGRVPQHVQNLVIRDYCQRRSFKYLLSATEYAMPGCYLMLESVLDGIERLGGIVFYSLFMLPDDLARRREIYRRVFGAGASLHGAVENYPIGREADVERFEDLWLVNTFVHRG